MKGEADEEAAEGEVVGDDTRDRFRRNRLNHDPTQLDSQEADDQLEAAISYALPSSPEVAREAAGDQQVRDALSTLDRCSYFSEQVRRFFSVSVLPSALLSSSVYLSDISQLSITPAASLARRESCRRYIYHW